MNQTPVYSAESWEAEDAATEATEARVKDIITEAFSDVGWTPEGIAQHVLDVLKAHRVVLVQLPEPMVNEWGDRDFPVPIPGYHRSWNEGFVRTEERGGSVVLTAIAVPSPLPSEHAQAYAAALLAAAAEVNQ